MPKAIPAHLQQHHNQQQQQKLEAQAQYKSDATRDPSFSSQQHDSGGADASMMAMMTSGRSSGGTATQQQQWHRDEHNRFIQALETYGREQSGDEWTKIAGFVQTRSIDEVRQHGRQYLQQLVQELSTTGRALQSIGSLEFAITPSAAGADGSENKDQHDSQNDPNGPNYQVLLSAGATGKPLKSARSRVKSAGGGSRFNSQSSKNLQQQQQNLTGVLAPSALKTPQQGAPAPAARKSGGRKPKIWTFEEDKIFENALANWSSDKPYSWPKIATALPGKTAKDARSRYEKLVGDIAMIETTEELEPQAHGQQRVQAAQVPPRSGGLSSRISPPPPIQVQPAGVSATEEDKGILHHICTIHLRVSLGETDISNWLAQICRSNVDTRTFSVNVLSPRCGRYHAGLSQQQPQQQQQLARCESSEWQLDAQSDVPGFPHERGEAAGWFCCCWS